MNKIIIQITSGRGPAECCWAVAQVLKAVISEADKKGLVHEVLAEQKGAETGTLVSASLQISGSGIAGFVQSWEGTVQWIGQSPFRKYHKRKNWYVGVKSLEAGLTRSSLNVGEIKYQAVRSGGPGGQHVNKVCTAVRATHRPTGLSVFVSEMRSQHQNKQLAKERLLLLWEEQQQGRLKDREKDHWQNHNELERGNPIRVYEGRKFRRRK